MHTRLRYLGRRHPSGAVEHGARGVFNFVCPYNIFENGANWQPIVKKTIEAAQCGL